jgi:4'-phosphopantetheinyl transferase EntD
MVNLLCRVSEIADLTSDQEIAERGKLLFSIKESIYKCIWPFVQCFVDYCEVAVKLDPSGNGFSVVSHTEKVPEEITRRLSGSYRMLDDLIVSSAWILVR